jgi:inorganic phosphate transporter, PiT family
MEASANVLDVAPPTVKPKTALDDKLKTSQPGRWFGLGFGALIVGGLIYAGSQLMADLESAQTISVFAYCILGLALLVALGFEFVNGFHDTANAVATVIYTHSLEPHAAVIWSGVWNFIGVLVSSGAVAFGIISLLPVELILQVGSGAGFAMVFALLTAAILWNVGTWWLGLPASSSHTLIGSIIGVGIANQMLSARAATSGVDWAQAANVGRSLLLSPLVGFAAAAGLLLISKKLIKDKRLYTAPEGNDPPPFWIRALLLLTCTGVSFAHGSNDGQKGMGLIMLILIGTVPTAYALNRAVPAQDTQDLIAVSVQAREALKTLDESAGATVGDPREVLKDYLREHTWKPIVVPALMTMMEEVAVDLARFKELAKVPPEQMRNFRNDLYVIGETLRIAQKSENLVVKDPLSKAVVGNYQKHVEQSTRFIPTWVKVAVAMALGMGTMVGWKRIVVTVGEKIGKDHLTYGQGASAELVAMTTIGAADIFGLPVSTTHVLSSGVAGTMAANRSGLQWGTIRNLLMAWVLTLPASIGLSALLFWAFSQLI